MVYARDPEGRLCEWRAPSKDAMKTPLVNRSARRAISNHDRRVAIWDVNHTFPRLEETVAAMNRAQKRFGFEPVDFSAPIGTWRRVKGHKMQLDCDEAAQKLQHKPQELGVQFLFCVTDRPLMYKDENGDVDVDYYNWWPDDKDGRILIFSTHYLDEAEIRPPPPRAIANALVQSLVGVLASVGTHARGPETCPLFRDPNADMSLIIGPESFDKRCEKLLRKKIPDDFDALDVLLRVFD